MSDTEANETPKTEEAPKPPTPRDRLVAQIEQYKAAKDQALANVNYFIGKEEAAQESLALLDEALKENK